MGRESKGRITFANQLRGVAALSVACSHLIGVFWAIPEVVTVVTFSPPQTGSFPALFWLISHRWFNLGPFGVGLFFLISGFVIPFSLEKHSRTTFFLARLLRIYPTYVAALLLEMIIVYAASMVWGRPFIYDARAIVSNASLTYDLIGQSSIDLVNWTLSVELKFYMAMMVLMPAIRRGAIAPLIAASACLFGLNAMIAAGIIGRFDDPPSTLSYTFSSHSVCIIYMFLGTVFNLHLRGLIRIHVLTGSLVILAALFVATWNVSVWRSQYPVVTVNYGYALVVFGTLYALREWVPRNRVLDGMASISFPFYALHSLLGYTVLRVLMVGAGIGYYPALAVAFATILALSLALHRAVERPSVHIGHRLKPAASHHHVILSVVEPP